jgi:Uma2 family endonuclease
MTRATRTKAVRELTLEEYLRTPVTNRHQEVVDGVIVMSPATTYRHQEILTNLMMILVPYVRQYDLGVIVPAPCDLLIRRQPKLRVRQPDLMFIGRGRASRESLVLAQILECTPDLAVEIVSPSDTPARWADKLADYASIGIPEILRIDSKTESVEVLALTEGVYRLERRFDRDEDVRTRALPGLALPVRSIFA